MSLLGALFFANITSPPKIETTSKDSNIPALTALCPSAPARSQNMKKFESPSNFSSAIYLKTKNLTSITVENPKNYYNFQRMTPDSSTERFSGRELGYMHAFFDAIDHNQDGKLSTKEVELHLGEGYRQFFHEFDHDEKGFVLFDDLIPWFQRMKANCKEKGNDLNDILEQIASRHESRSREIRCSVELHTDLENGTEKTQCCSCCMKLGYE